MEPRVNLGAVVQIGIVVRDLQKTIAEYWNTFGIGPWSIWNYDPTVVADMTYQGKPHDYGWTIALAQVGSVQWEVIEPLWGESIHTEFLRKHGEGLHHVAYLVDDAWEVVEDLKVLGLDVIESGYVKGRPFIYLDTEQRLGTCFELIGTGFEHLSPDSVYPEQAGSAIEHPSPPVECGKESE